MILDIQFVTNYQYLPTREHGEILARRMSARLLRSLSHIASRVSDVSCDQSAGSEVFDHLSAILNHGSYFSPGLYLLHNDLLLAASSNDLKACERLFDEVLEKDWSAGALSVREFSAAEFGEREYKRFSNCLNVDPTTPTAVTVPDAETVNELRESISQAFQLLKASSPDHFAEVNAVLAEIVLAKNATPETYAFSGASSFSAWGAIFLSADEGRSVIDLLQAIVHETAHLVLFAETLDGPLVQNDPNERYKSPLRMNPRPMDGIYHATFVSARMYQAIHELQQRLGDEFEFGDILVNALAQNRQNFNEGYEVVMRDADLTEIGNHLIKGATDYMASAT
jgi:hypothetical protein